jgi:hypothetical protein
MPSALPPNGPFLLRHDRSFMDIFMASTQLKCRANDVIKRVADFCYWPEADVTLAADDVRFRG